MEINNELIAKAKAAATVEELIALATENGITLTEDDAKMYFEVLHPKTGELSDDELDNVAGGGCYAPGGNLLTTIGHGCKYYEEGRKTGAKGTCCRCKYWGNDPYQKGSLWTMILDGLTELVAPRQCYHPANRK